MAAAGYLNIVHRGIHPLFEPLLLQWQEMLAPVVVSVGMVIEGETGELVGVEVICPSPSTQFDETVVSALAAAFPLLPEGRPPVSHDGRIYVGWDIHSDPTLACSAYFSRPFLLQRRQPAE